MASPPPPRAARGRRPPARAAAGKNGLPLRLRGTLVPVPRVPGPFRAAASQFLFGDARRRDKAVPDGDGHAGVSGCARGSELDLIRSGKLKCEKRISIARNTAANSPLASCLLVTVQQFLSAVVGCSPCRTSRGAGARLIARLGSLFFCSRLRHCERRGDTATADE